jgi:SAM-dependent methyltransferase
MDKFCGVDLEVSNLEELEDDFFDVVIFTHVIEHLNNGLEVLSKISKKLKKGGKIYIEFPSIRSLSLPSSAISTLNFCDDESHVRVYDIKEVANTLLKNNVRIIRAGRRKTLNGYIIFILSIPLQLYSLLRYKKLHAKGLWDVCGFADYVYGEKK